MDKNCVNASLANPHVTCEANDEHTLEDAHTAIRVASAQVSATKTNHRRLATALQDDVYIRNTTERSQMTTMVGALFVAVKLVDQCRTVA